MLSNLQQKMILKMFGFWLKREFWERRNLRDFYRSESSFYKAIRYLEDSGIVSFEYNQGVRMYFLTEKGIILARILCEMPEVPARIKRLADLRRWDELDMKMFGESGVLNG